MRSRFQPQHTFNLSEFDLIERRCTGLSRHTDRHLIISMRLSKYVGLLLQRATDIDSMSCTYEDCM